MIDRTIVDKIRAHGVYTGTFEERRSLLEDGLGFSPAANAEYVLITGCLQPQAMPGALRALRELLDRLNVDYTLLAKEYCCGWMPFGQPAVISRDEEALARARELSCGFVVENFRQAEALGAKAIALFCAACEPAYTNCAGVTDLEIISYSELIDRHFTGARLDREIDYYAGCYRFRRRVTDVPVDLEPALRVLDKVEGLKVNHLDNTQCCYIPPHLEALTGSMKTDTLVTICTGCYQNLSASLKERGVEVEMLPELLLEAVDS